MHILMRGARSMSSLYNCMGMVFASRRTCIEPEHLPMILNDDEYRRVANKGDLQRGDIVVYRDDDGEVSHVGIVADVTTDPAKATWDVLVLSQWGRHGEYFHLDEDVSFEVTDLTHVCDVLVVKSRQ